ncbi:MAG: DUF3860 domain-containing protein [Candidatus Poseidoniaceae archaeon]|jgi:hypothetical protein|nr:DUF3860 domain-containing protein [Candidatus Poseidoniaceae archaeon]
MSRTRRIREAVRDYLDNHGEANTNEIYQHINQRFRWGATMSQLGNVLARDKRFAKAGFDNDRFTDGGRSRVCIWTLKQQPMTAEV